MAPFVFACQVLALAVLPAGGADFTQADEMLELLEAVPSASAAARVEAVLNARGTDLIVAQQNISRKVTKAQYATLLRQLAAGRSPALEPADGSERARRGLEGLLKNVWPSLQWGAAHTGLLLERIGELKKSNPVGQARLIASRFLPEPVTFSSRVFVVLGGRAGAAALDGGDIYFDVLATSYSAATGQLGKYPLLEEQIEFIAHELHHQGLAEIIGRTRRRLNLAPAEARAFDVLTALVMEGSASYLINGHRSLDALRKDPQFAENLGRGDALLSACQDILRAVLEKELEGEAYDAAVAPMLGSGWHSAGAMLLAAIDRHRGLEGIFEVLRDPRRLPAAYDAAASEAGASNPWRFDPALARKISLMGQTP